MEFFERYWLILPLASTILIILAFYPFNLWWLGFVALAPLFYFASFSNRISLKKLFVGGFIFGVGFSFTLAYFSLVQFRWLPETYLFIWLVRASAIPIALISGLAGGAAIVLYRLMRLNFLIDIFIGASIWTAIEWLVGRLFGGYNFGLLAYVAHDTPLVALASIGGISLVSFLVALVNIFVVAHLLIPRYRWLYPEIYEERARRHPAADRLTVFLRTGRPVFFAVLATIVIIGLTAAANYWYLQNQKQTPTQASFAVIQLQERSSAGFGTFSNNGFSFPVLEKSLVAAGQLKPDFIIYPFAMSRALVADTKEATLSVDKRLVDGTYEELKPWLKNNVPKNSIFIVWNDILRQDGAYNEFNFWKNGGLVGVYKKRELFPFLDYTPYFSQRLGLYTTPLDALPGPAHQSLTFNGVSFGNLLCSELVIPYLAREDAKTANILLAIGSEAIFSDNTAGNFNILAAQFRAAETHRPVIRANRFGPSAFIDKWGKIIKRLDYGAGGVLFDKLQYNKTPAHTLYEFWGDWGFMGGAFIFLTLITLIKIARFLKFREKQAC